MKLVDQWRQLEERLPEDWQEVRLAVRTESPADLSRAAAVLAPIGAGRVGDSLVVTIRRAGGQSGPEAARRLFGRLDASRTWSSLELLDVRAREEEEAAPGSVPIVASWEAAIATLSPDWSDIVCELELDSSDHLPRAALLCAPLNPTRDPGKLALIFRCGRRGGRYGASPGMVRRCLERCDQESLTGRVTVLWALSETDTVATQGPVWYVGGRVL